MSIRKPGKIPHVTINYQDLPLAVQLTRYLFVGGLAFLADFGTLFVLTEWIHIHYLHSAILAFLVGMGLNYFLSIAWVFKVRAVKSAKMEFLLFALVGVVGLGLNEILLWTLTQGLNLFYLHSKFVAAGVVLAWNFSARKLLLFTSPSATSLEGSS